MCCLLCACVASPLSSLSRGTPSKRTDSRSASQPLRTFGSRGGGAGGRCRSPAAAEMLEDQVAFLLQKYLGNYVRGLSKEALKISVWRGQSGRLAAATSPLIRPSLLL